MPGSDSPSWRTKFAASPAATARVTSEKVQKSMNAGQQGVAVATEVAEKLEMITANTRKLNELAQSVSMASQQQSWGIAQISGSAAQMHQRIQSTAAGAEEGDSRANQFSEQARTLDKLATELSEMFQRRS